MKPLFLASLLAVLPLTSLAQTAPAEAPKAEAAKAAAPAAPKAATPAPAPQAAPAAASNGQAATAQPNGKINGKGPLKWAYNDSADANTKAVTRKAVLPSSKPIDLPYPFETSVRGFISVGKEDKKPTEIRLWVSPGQIACPGSCEISVQFGKAAPLLLKAEPASNGIANSVRIVEPAKVLAGLRRSRQAKVEMPLFEAGKLSFDFAAASALEWAYTK